MFLKRLHLSSMRLLVVQNHCESPEVRCDGGGGVQQVVTAGAVSHHHCSVMLIHSEHRWRSSTAVFHAVPCVCGVAVWFLRCRGLSAPHCTALHTLCSSGYHRVFGTFVL